MRRGELLNLAAQLGAVLFLIAAVVGYLCLDRSQFNSWQDLAVLAGPVASASLLFVAAAMFAPGLLAPRRLAFPLNVTLPIVFAALVRASVVLWLSPQSAVFATQEALRPAMVWTRPFPLIYAAVAQCFVLSCFALTARKLVTRR